MPRTARLIAASHTYHVTSRGNRREAIFFDADDYRRWERILTRTVERHEWRCLAYALLPNHFHLLVTCSCEHLGRGMNLLNGMYGQAFNRRHGYVGHLFQDRYGSEAVENDGHLLESLRYIVLNPPRAGLSAQPEEWPWGSYAASLGLEADRVGIAAKDVLELFASDLLSARAGLRSFVAEGL